MESTVFTDEGQLTLRQAHERYLIGDRTLPLVKLHWYLLHASASIDRKCSDTARSAAHPGEGDSAIRLPTSASECLGEVGRDEINWWVTRGESDHAALKRRAEQALPHAVRLKRESKKLSQQLRRYNRYVEVLKTLSSFLDQYGADFVQLADFVEWLHQRDESAPAIMFTYRVWGSTRLHERSSPLTAGLFDEEKPEVLSLLAELVIGLNRAGTQQFDDVRLDMDSERYESCEYDGQCDPATESEVVPNMAHQVLGDFAEYFSFLRQSIENILLEISRYEKTRATLESRDFWCRFILAATRAPIQETELWDFKETLSLWHTTGKEREKACLKTAEQVAAFANASGGVLIVGVANDRSIKGLAKSQPIESNLKDVGEVLCRYLKYPRPYFKLLEIPVVVAGRPAVSCLAIVVAQTSDVVSVCDDERYSYPIRVATGLRRSSRDDVFSYKLSVLADNYDFVTEQLSQFVAEAERNT